MRSLLQVNTWLIISIFCCHALSSVGTNAGTSAVASAGANNFATSTVNLGFKSFQDWKKEKIQAAFVQTNTIRTQILKAYLDSNTKLQESLERQLNQVRWNSEVARDLSVTDYFVLYLSQQNQPDRFQLAAQRMTTAEVAELIEAYTGILGYKKTELAADRGEATMASKKPNISAQAAQQK